VLALPLKVKKVEDVYRVNALTPARQDGAGFAYPAGMEG